MTGTDAAGRRVLGPFNRVEGDIEVTLDISDGAVREAWVSSPLFRGFETILEGRDPTDALVIVPRICGICSVSQSVAAARALADAAGITPADNGRLATELTLSAETMADHLTHFYLFFMPDLARDAYRGRRWWPDAARRFKATTGESARALTRARTRLLHVTGTLAGKWPHSLALQPGGTTQPVDLSGKVRLREILSDTRRFLEDSLFGGPLEEVAALDTPEALFAWGEERPGADLSVFLAAARDLDFGALGRTGAPLMSVGSADGAFPAGLLDGDALSPIELAGLREEVAASWSGASASHPSEGTTTIALEREGAYTWCKAPRLDGRPIEVGALARQAVAGHPLIRALAADGSTVLARVAARLVETARLLPLMEAWVEQLRPRQPFSLPAPLSGQATGIGLVEAARGSLGHWMTVNHNRIERYQIVAPTTWNFSPRDADGVPGPLEAALAGVPAPSSETTPLLVQHVVRSFDPCMVCTVH